MKKKTETVKKKKTKAPADPSAPKRRTLTSEVREFLKAGMDKKKILEKMIASFVADGKDEGWARKRAKNKLAFILKQTGGEK